MGRLAMTSARGVEAWPNDPRYQYFITLLMESFGTMPDRTAWECLPALYSRLPLESCLLSMVIDRDETRQFKKRYDIISRACPVVLITEESPFGASNTHPCVVIELGLLKEPDDVRRILSSIADQAYSEDFLQQAKKGERLRRVERQVKRFDGLIGATVSLLGLV